MSTFDEIPEHLRGLESRAEFIIWLQQMPLSFHDRVRVYFSWIDRHQLSYADPEIDDLSKGGK